VSYKSLLIVVLLIGALTACTSVATPMPLGVENQTATIAPTPMPTTPLAPTKMPTASIVPTQMPSTVLAPTQVPTARPTAIEGTAVSYGLLRLVLPIGLASGIRGSQLTRAEGTNVAPWDVTPGHTQLKLEGYLLQGKFHEPRILVYPAQAYAEQQRAAFESLRRLNNILGNPSAPINTDQLPSVPFFNAAQSFASDVKVIAFQNGKGVRFLTEYAQYPVSANNQDLFYHFEGVTSDGFYYVIAILPITIPLLAETSDRGAVLPRGGVPYPDITKPNVDWKGYYAAVTNLLNAQSSESFAPTINRLDSLIQSVRINQ
jgi:hypothetical protein